jgi:hypothetical protein
LAALARVTVPNEQRTLGDTERETLAARLVDEALRTLTGGRA